MLGPSVDDNYGTSRSTDGHYLATAVTTRGTGIEPTGTRTKRSAATTAAAVGHDTQDYSIRIPPTLQEASSMEIGTSPRSVPGAGARKQHWEPTAPRHSAAPRDAPPIREGSSAPSPRLRTLSRSGTRGPVHLHGPGGRKILMDDIQLYDPSSSHSGIKKSG